MLHWQKITVEQYQALHRVITGPGREEDRLTDLVALITGKTPSEVNRLPVTRFTPIAGRATAFLESMPPVAAPRYVFPFRPLYDLHSSLFRFGMYVELQGLLRSESGAIDISKLHLAAASFYESYGRKNRSQTHSKRAGRILRLPFLSVYGSVLGIIQELQRFHSQYAGLLGIEDGEQEGGDDPFRRRHGWQFAAQQIAEYERITVDGAYDLPLTQAFNDLAYLKAKALHDKKLHDNAQQKH